ncbi:P-loop containing nucleoside triphosphate hydrolase protein [Tricharina praecox]|uniref:P-loop containing nucleoside triphosphate hydrolase protein n=1 Tax=Tricharina praecox TaxID=43433 RepID=UPI0022201990|nr:P-loop containing nucleoside triphosphate hydrolase protein [Tricharina praecox]KAI5848057.1 P-loop containing nucleoside triphosphate hydrolase protein [Tricharina praecox]
MSLEAKLVVLGTQGVGKTSLVVRYVKNTFDPASASTIGASFLAKKVVVDDCLVRLQIWDTAGQERYRSISKLYYRSANCGILCYDITSEASFLAMHSWLLELKKNINNNIIIHIVGTKADLVNADPSKREIPFERCVAYAAEHLGDNEGLGWMDTCHEISARDDTGVDEVFHVIARKLVERRQEIENERLYGPAGGNASNGGGGSGGGRGGAREGNVDAAQETERKKGMCC